MKKKIDNLKPLKKTLNFFNNRYKVEILYYLTLKKMRFGEIKENVDGITQQLLTKQLKELVKNNLIVRKQYNGFPRKVEYSLTAFGDSVNPIIKSLLKWEKINARKINYILKKRHLDSIFDYY